MRSRMLKERIVPILVGQLNNEETDVEAQGALVSLYNIDQGQWLTSKCLDGYSPHSTEDATFKTPIIDAGFIDALIKRLGNQSTFRGAAIALTTLMQHGK